MILGLLLSLRAVQLPRYADEVKAYPQRWALYFEGAEWARENLPYNCVVVDRKPNMFRLVSGRRTIMLPREFDDEKMLSRFREEQNLYLHVTTIPYDDVLKILHPFIGRKFNHFEGAWIKHGTDGAWDALLKFNPTGPLFDKPENGAAGAGAADG